MATLDVPVPNMGDSITEGTVSEWAVEVGNVVAADDLVVSIETDKVGQPRWKHADWRRRSPLRCGPLLLV